MGSNNKRCLLSEAGDTQNDPWCPFSAPWAIEHRGHNPPPGDQVQHCSPRRDNQKSKHTLVFGILKAIVPPRLRGKRGWNGMLQGDLRDPRSLAHSPLSLHTWCVLFTHETYHPSRDNDLPLPNEDPESPVRMPLLHGRVIQCSATFYMIQIPQPPSPRLPSAQKDLEGVESIFQGLGAYWVLTEKQG